jgi:ATP adenylyltransferase/5',5'''-P-1,P-4-tetraphosphate phosphorylase II
MIQEVEELYARQLQAWPKLAKGVAGLKSAKTRAVQIDWFTVFVRHIPHRMASTTASVDRESVARRPCFLCAGNLPAEEEGVEFDQDFMIYCNPLPIVDHHLTIVHREHGAQRIANRFGNILDLAAALPGYFVVYNGPECGASAPDHLHFQAGSRILFPIETDAAGMTGITVPGYARNVFLLRGRDRFALNARMERTLELLTESGDKRPEPMVNLAVLHERGEWLSYLFPRSKHRPEVFHSRELTVSPASIDLCGIFVVPLAQDFEKITGDAIAAIFREITLPDPQFQEVAQRLESWR